jgi:hypothetical protein
VAPIDVLILAIQRVAARGTQQDAPSPECRRVAEDAADIVGVRHAFEHDEHPGRREKNVKGRCRRPVHERDASAMHVVAGDRCQLVSAGNEYRHLRVEPGDRRAELALGGLVHQHGLHAIPPVFDDAPEYVAPLGDKQPARTQELAVAHALIRGNARIVCTLNSFDRHSAP